MERSIRTRRTSPWIRWANTMFLDQAAPSGDAGPPSGHSQASGACFVVGDWVTAAGRRAGG